MKKVLFLLMVCLFLIGCRGQAGNGIQDDAVFHLNDEYYHNNSFVLINGEGLRSLENNGNSFIAFVFMPMCHASAQLYDVVTEFMTIRGIGMYRIPFSHIEGTRMADAITYFPTVVIYRDGVVRSFLEADSNEHIPYYQSAEGLESWLVQYIYLTDRSGLPRHSRLEDITFEDDVVNIYYFWGNGCRFCAMQFEFLVELNEEMGDRFNLYSFEIWFDEDNAAFMHEIAELMDATFEGVPFTFIGDRFVTGFLPDDILAAIDAATGAEFDVMRIFKEGR